MDAPQYSNLNITELRKALKFFDKNDSEKYFEDYIDNKNHDHFEEDILKSMQELDYMEFLVQFEERYGLLIKNYREQKRLRFLKIIKNIMLFYLILSLFIGFVWAIFLIANE